MLELKGVATQYLYGARLFGALDLTVKDGEIISLYGGRGSGKTTLLKTVAGIEESEGSILLDGAPLKRKTDDVIMLFDDGAVFKTKTVFDNLAYPLAIRHYDKKEIATRVIRAAEGLNIGACLNTRAFNLTSVEKKRMSAARLFLRDAKLLLVDDFTDGLSARDADELTFDMMRMLYAKAKTEGTSVIYSSADRNTAFGIADRTAVLVGGEVKQIGTRKEMYDKPTTLWSAEAADENYNSAKARLTFDNDVLNLVFGAEYGDYVLDVTPLKNAVAPEYFNREVIVGWHAEDCKYCLSKVVFSSGYGTKYILETENGLKVLSDEKTDAAPTMPSATAVTLFDLTENSVMRDL